MSVDTDTYQAASNSHRCCKRMGASDGKPRNKRSTALPDESSPFNYDTNPMNATADYTTKE